MKKLGCIVASVCAIGAALFLVLPMLSFPKTKAVRSFDMNCLSQIGKACMMYAMDHNGQYPPDFAALTPYADYPKLYVSRHDRERAGAMSNVMDWTSFVYHRGITTASPPESVVAYLPPGHHEKTNGGIMLFADGSVQWMALPDFTRKLNQTPTKDCTLSTEGAPSVEK